MLLSHLVNLIKKGNSNFISANIYEDLNIDDAASLDTAVKHQISFLEENNILKEKLDQTKASSIKVNPTAGLSIQQFVPISTKLIIFTPPF